MATTAMAFCIRSYSDLNPEMDFCIMPHDIKQLYKVEEIVEKVWNTFFSDSNQQPVGDILDWYLKDAGIEADVFFHSDWG